MKITKTINAMNDVAVDMIDKVSGSTSRAGVSVDRVGKMAKGGVGTRTIATQMTENSHTGQVYKAEHIEGIKMLFKDVQTKVGVTAAQARALMADQHSSKQAAAPATTKSTPDFG